MEGRDGFGFQIDDLDAMVIGVRNVHLVAGDAKTCRLAEDRSCQPACRFIAQKGAARARARIDDLDLAVIGIRHVELSFMIGYAQGMLKANLVAYAVHVAKLE